MRATPLTGVPAATVVRLLETKNAAYWEAEGKRRALSLFYAVAQQVPAYKDFLKKNSVRPASIKTWKDFEKLPLVSKKNYLRQYPLKDLCWGGSLNKPLTFTATSGSTGAPFYFPRQLALDEQYATIIESYLRAGNLKKNESTLVIVCFGMGVWIGGLITYKAFEIAANRLGAPVSIITPGINKVEIFNALKLLAPQYDQVILIGYPPFIKDIIDEAPSQQIALKKLHLRLMFAAEAFTEPFRNYLAKHAGVKNVFTDMLNVYGSADIGAMAYETGVSILIKRLAVKRPQLFTELFTTTTKSPTLAQFNPLHIYFESVNGEIALTGNNAVPLIRYAIGDNGGVWNYAEVKTVLQKHGIAVEREAQRAHIRSVPELPFVYLYERKDFSTTLYGLQVYPETVREVLNREPYASVLSGKLTLLTKFNNKQDQFIDINVECRKKQKLSLTLQHRLIKDIHLNLKKQNSEYRELSQHVKDRPLLRLTLWPAEDPTYFKPGIKQNWVKK